MARELETYRLHPVILNWIKGKAKDLCRSRSFIIEAVVSEQAKDELPPWFKPGMKMEDEK